MSRLTYTTKDRAQATMESLYKDLERRIVASPPGLCPIDLTASFIKMSLAQSCGKCTPCRVGLKKLAELFDLVLDNKADLSHLELIKQTAESIYLSADCAIGYQTGKTVMNAIAGCMDDFLSHIESGICTCNSNSSVSCVQNCPAGVDVPGYIALIREGRLADAIRLIRRDNPMPAACAYICEHPCESLCKRNIIDAPINIRGLKKYAVDNAGDVPVPECAPATGKKVAIIGGGPSGLTTAYYLSLMGHKVTIFEQRQKLGGMLRYGIPNYRLPREVLDREIESILSTGVEVRLDVTVGTDITFDQLKEEFDATFISIGVHAVKRLGIEGEDSAGVISAVEMLREIGYNILPDYSGKRVVVIGGGNVAMDVARSSIRLGAESVSIVYRRRKSDMTALPEEVEGAEAEGCDVFDLMAPVRIEADEKGHVSGLWVQPQRIGHIVKGRPVPLKANMEPIFIPCDLIVVAIGQNLESQHFADTGLTIVHNQIVTDNTGRVPDMDGIFSGGDCVSGPATVIMAIAAGKVVAANIDNYLGFHHEIACDVEIPVHGYDDKIPCGRVEVAERPASERKFDLDPVEHCMSHEEACQEAGRCLRCDHIGFGALRGGRVEKW